MSCKVRGFQHWLDGHFKYQTSSSYNSCKPTQKRHRKAKKGHVWKGTTGDNIALQQTQKGIP